MTEKHAHSKSYEKFIKSLLVSPSINLGCGNFKIADINVDINKKVNPDIVWNLNKFPYPFGKREYKSVLLHHSLEHLNNPDKVLNECKKLLQKNGRVVIIVPSPQNPRYRMKGHKQFFTKNSLFNLVSKYFTDVKIFGYRGDTKNWPTIICKILGHFISNQFICVCTKT
jgi:predicted SAM-dependent methyltransferase